MWTFNIHWAQRMPCGRFLVRTAGNWKSSQGLVISHNLLNMFSFLLLNDLLLLYLQFSQVLLVLLNLYFHLMQLGLS